MNLDPKALSLTEAAQLYGVSRQRVHDWIKDGRLKAVMLWGRWIIPRGQERPTDKRYTAN